MRSHETLRVSLVSLRTLAKQEERESVGKPCRRGNRAGSSSARVIGPAG